MPKIGRYQFPENPEIKRRSGSDWIKTTGGAWKKLRSWNSTVSEWKPTNLGKVYYKDRSEFVVSIPCHYVIAKPKDDVIYRGYFPVSQLKNQLKGKLHEALHQGGDKSALFADVKTKILQMLNAMGTMKIPIEGLGQVYPIHYESDLLIAYRPETPRNWKYSELKIVDEHGREDQQVLLNAPMRSYRARPNIINAMGICDYAFHETPPQLRRVPIQ